MKKAVDPIESYDLKSVKLPRLMGRPLRLMAALLEGPFRWLLIPNLLQSAGITKVRELKIDEAPTYFPIHKTEKSAEFGAHISQSRWPKDSSEKSDFHFATVHDYASAYRKGRMTPEDAAVRVLDAISAGETNDPQLRAFIAINSADVMQQAREATERLKSGRPLSIFDGVPVAVKDEVDVAFYPTTVGTSFLGKKAAAEDATVVARFRNAGAVIIGKTNMHEIGIGVSGSNPHYGTPRNPYDPARFTGGSSSGSAAAVAAGFCPAAIGADGGGSIRIPASFCGLVGLKSTFGRVSEHGAAPLDWSVAHLGPLAATAADAALAWAIMAGPDEKDALSLHQPAPTLDGWDNLDLSDLTLGVYRPWFRHADESVVFANETMLAQLQEKGAKVCEVTLPDLDAGRVAHSITISSEMAQAQSRYYEQHHRDYSLEVRISLALARQFTARDYVQAQRIRTRIINNFQTVLQDVDVILTPTTGIVAPVIPRQALSLGISDLTMLTEIMRFCTFANFTGLPAISFPAGYDGHGMPIGMQAIGGPWQEALLLRLAWAAEKVVDKKKPAVFFDILA